RRRSLRRRGLAPHPRQDHAERDEAAEQVRAVGAGEQVEEGTVRIAREIDPLPDELPPCQQLSGEECEAEPPRRGDVPAEAGEIPPPEAPPAPFEDGAAREQDPRIEPQDRRKRDRRPGPVLPVAEVGRGERHKQHGDRREGEPESKGHRARRHWFSRRPRAFSIGRAPAAGPERAPRPGHAGAGAARSVAPAEDRPRPFGELGRHGYAAPPPWRPAYAGAAGTVCGI